MLQVPVLAVFRPLVLLVLRVIAVPLSRARINEERILNRIDSNRRFLMSRLEFDSIWWENTALGSIGKPRVLEIL